MKISRIILKGVNNFEDFDYSFEDEWSKTVPESLLLLGSNGAGKTTILRSIANLWSVFGTFLEGQERATIKSDLSIFSNCRLAAIQIKDFLPEVGEPIWIYFGEAPEVRHSLLGHIGSHRITAALSVPAASNRSYKLEYISPNYRDGDSVHEEQGWVKELRERFIKNRLGGHSDLPNVIFLESEARILPEIKEEYSVIPEKEDFNWLARYSANLRREGSIQNYLFTLKAINEDKYKNIITATNKFLVDKKVDGFDKKTAELLINTELGQAHPAHLLSSGEKQVLLMIAFIARELRPGGIVLIDEPDLHLHVSLSTAFVSYLKQMVAEQNGQLIIASHAPELWERFTQAERVELGSVVEAA